MSSSLLPSARFLVCVFLWLVIPGPPNVADRFLHWFLSAKTSAELTAASGKSPAKIKVSASTYDQGTRVTIQLGAPLQVEMRQEELRVVLLFGNNSLELSQEGFHYKDALVSSISLDQSPGANQLLIQLTSRNIQTRLSHFASQNVYLLELRKQEMPAAESKETSSSEILPPSSSREGFKWRHITIDAGHGGQDKGTLIKENLFEKDVTLAIGKKLRWALQARLGISVVLSRTEDQALTIEERALTANQAQSDVFISLHIGNSNLARKSVSYAYALKPSWGDSGTGEVKEESGPRKLFIPWEESQWSDIHRSERLAGLIQEEMNRSLNGGDNSLRSRQAPLRLLTPLAMPAVLVEIGDASSVEFIEKAGRNAFQNLVAATISIAVEKFRSLQERP